MRDVFARIAYGGPVGFDELARGLDSTGVPPRVALRTRRGRRWLVALARVIAAQDLEPSDHPRAIALFNGVFDRHGAAVLDPEAQTVYAQLLFLTGDVARCTDVLPALRGLPPVVAHYLRCDLANPVISPSSGREQEWLDLVCTPFVANGLAPIRLLGGSGPLFDQLDAAVSANRGGRLVSVIMPAYRPDGGLETSVRSIIRQTWADIELIIVDDASGTEFAERFQTCAELDSRVRVIHQPINGGTYLARNAGLDAARGEFVTFQDSDDWSHPQRIERQIAPLLADPDRLATRTLAVRARTDLTHQWLGYPAQRVNASSLLFRRARVMQLLGYFDSIRKGGDAEYAFRLEAVFGRAIEDVQQPLAYTRLRPSSLSRSDFTLGWSAPARITHQGAYRHWHRELAKGGSPYLPRHLDRRPFPVPPALLHAIPGAKPGKRQFDVTFLDDWQAHSGPREGGLEEIATLQERGLTVSLAHREAIGRMTKSRQHLDPTVQQAINAGSVDQVLLDDDVSTSLLIVRDPAILQFASTAPARLRADRVVVVAALAPADYPGLSTAYDVASCSANVETVFGHTPRWFAAHRLLVEPVGAADVIPQPVDLGRWSTPRSPHRLRRDVIGRYDADTPLAWPDDRSVIRHAYPHSGLVDMRVLGPISTAMKVLDRGTSPPSWLVYSRDEISLRAFLFQLDFFVYFPSTAVTFAPQDLLARAMASGAVVLAPERFRDQLGDSAVYCPPEAVTATVRRYHKDPDVYSWQVKQGRKFVAREHSPDIYAKRIADLLKS